MLKGALGKEISILKIFILLLILIQPNLAIAQDRIHYLIPGGAGGGWDMTARGVGEVMSRTGIVDVASYENLSGNGGGRAIGHLIDNAHRQMDTLMVNSSSLILNPLLKKFEYTFRDLTPIASVIADYGAFVVKTDSPFNSWQDVIAAYKRDYRRVNIAGGSSRGSTDHVVAALAFAKSGLDIKRLKYIPYNAGGQAMVGLLSGESQILSTGLSEAIALAEQGEVRVLAITAPERLPLFSNIPTIKEQGVDAVFANWRGFFAAPGLDSTKIKDRQDRIDKMLVTDEWKKLRDTRGWSHFYIVGEEFYNYLVKQEQEMSRVLTDLGLISQ